MDEHGKRSPPSSWTAIAGAPTSMAMEDHTSGSIDGLKILHNSFGWDDMILPMFLQDEDRLQSPSFNLQSGQGSSSVGETLSDLPVSGSPRKVSDVDLQVGPDPLTVGPGLSAVDDNLIDLISTSSIRISDVEPQAGIGPSIEDEIQLEHISESPVNEEPRQDDQTIDETSRDQVQDLSRPGWRRTPYFVVSFVTYMRQIFSRIEAFDLFVELLVLILEISQVMITNSTIVGWMVLGFNIGICVTKWTLLFRSIRRTSAPFLHNGQKYIEPSAATMQVIFSAASIKVKFPWRILVLQLLLSTAMFSSKVTMTYNRTSHSI